MGKVRTNWNRNLIRYGERTGRVGMMYGSVKDSIDCSAGYNARKVADWIGVSCSIRFLYIDGSPTADEHHTCPMRYFPTYVESTDMYAGFNMIYISQGSRVTAANLAQIMVFDWQAIVVSL